MPPADPPGAGGPADPKAVRLAAHRTLLLSRYAYDLGVPLPEFLVRIGLCPPDQACLCIALGSFRLDGRVLDDPSRVIRAADLQAGSVAELFEQRVTLGFWSDEESPPYKPPTRVLLYVNKLERWDEFNEYEGACRAVWNGREHCFRVILVGDEWDRVRVGATWEADIYFDCDTPVEVLNDAPDLVPELTAIAGINYTLCGRILSRDDDGALVATPHTLYAVASSSQYRGRLVEPGRWLRCRGSLQARMPD